MTGFRITARTLFHLGADLISTDAMALYELVKNAFDAKSERVRIDVVWRVPVVVANPILTAMATRLEDPRSVHIAELDEHRSAVLRSLTNLPVPELTAAVERAGRLDEILEAYSAVNEIVVRDTGDGMSLEDLDEIFLTVGTMSRKRVVDERRREGVAEGARPVLGEKGVGRLSAMRLGSRLRVETVRAQDERFAVLDLDWSQFSRHPDRLLEQIEVTPRSGSVKTRPKGTELFIRQLTEDWSLVKLEDIARTYFSRLTDPFEERPRFPIDVAFNGAPVAIPAFRKLLLDQAHAVVTASFGPDDPVDLMPNGRIAPGAKLRLRGKVDYRLQKRTLPIDLSDAHLRSAASASEQTLRDMGPFDLQIYWYNRPLLEKDDTIGSVSKVRELVNEWSGGIAVYRDGFRVGGYGSGADDWLGLDRKALASGGYKVNRAQIIGRLSISSLANPALIDQTNREGLRDSPEKAALVALLKHVLESIFRPFLAAVDEEIQAREPVDLKKLAEQVLQKRRSIAATIRLVYQRYPELKSDPEIGGRIEEALNAIGEMMRSLEELGASYRRGREQMTVLAGIGLSVAAIAHELRQVANNAKATVDGLRRKRSVSNLGTALAPLATQLKTLLTRLRVLDPLVTSGRQVKTETDIPEWVTTIVQSAAPTFENEGVRLELRVIRGDPSDTFVRRVVQGMIVQVLSNLLDNARYWLARSKLDNPHHDAVVLVEVDVPRKEVRVSDNGPGVPPSMRATIFNAFVTTKPPGAGLGLGLFISREIATYSDASLDLLDPASVPPGFSTTFALSFRKVVA